VDHRDHPTFGPATAATYRPYWHLAVEELGDRRLAELTTTDLAGVVDAAAERAAATDPAAPAAPRGRPAWRPSAPCAPAL